MRTATKHTVGALVVVWALSAGTARADTMEMFGCGVVGRTATVELGSVPGPTAIVDPRGLVIQYPTPVDMARTYMDDCDFVALGRFSSITVKDYARAVPEAVVALFVVDEPLLGVERTSVKVRVSGGMLVQARELINRHTAWNVYHHDRSLTWGIYKATMEDFHDLQQGEIALTDVLPGLERNIKRLSLDRLRPITRSTELRFAQGDIAAGDGSTFYLEGGAIHPDTQFLLGLDAVAHPGHDQLTPIYTLLHWGDYAVQVAGAIRAAAE